MNTNYSKVIVFSFCLLIGAQSCGMHKKLMFARYTQEQEQLIQLQENQVAIEQEPVVQAAVQPVIQQVVQQVIQQENLGQDELYNQIDFFQPQFATQIGIQEVLFTGLDEYNQNNPLYNGGYGYECDYGYDGYGYYQNYNYGNNYSDEIISNEYESSYVDDYRYMQDQKKDSRDHYEHKRRKYDDHYEERGSRDRREQTHDRHDKYDRRDRHDRFDRGDRRDRYDDRVRREYKKRDTTYNKRQETKKRRRERHFEGEPEKKYRKKGENSYTNKNTSLHNAIMRTDIEAIKKYWEYMFTRGDGGMFPIAYAMNYKYKKEYEPKRKQIVYTLLDLVKKHYKERYTYVLNNIYKGFCGESFGLLYFAISKGFTDLAEFLIQEGASIMVCSSAERTTLFQALILHNYKKRDRIIGLLLEELKKKRYKGKVDEYLNKFVLIKSGWVNPLHLAVVRGDEYIVKKLIDAGVDISLRAKSSRLNSLNLALNIKNYKSRENIIEMFLREIEKNKYDKVRANYLRGVVEQDGVFASPLAFAKKYCLGDIALLNKLENAILSTKKVI